MVDENTMAEIGLKLGERFAERELIELADLLDAGAEAAGYVADDLAERADYERKTNGSEEQDFTDAAEGYTETRDHLANLAAAIRAGEKQGRED